MKIESACPDADRSGRGMTRPASTSSKPGASCSVHRRRTPSLVLEVILRTLTIQRLRSGLFAGSLTREAPAWLYLGILPTPGELLSGPSFTGIQRVAARRCGWLGLTSPMTIFSAHSASPPRPRRPPASSRASGRQLFDITANSGGPRPHLCWVRTYRVGSIAIFKQGFALFVGTD